MSTYKFILSSLLMLVVGILQSGMASAGEATAGINIPNGQTIFNEGKGEAAACQGCHGEKALGNDAMGAPRLANIGQGYLIKQLTEFAADKRTPSGAGAAMNGFAKALNEQDRRDLAGYLNTLDYEIDPSDLKALATDGNKVGQPELGKAIVTQGIKGKLPPCQDCHGFNGRDPRELQKNSPMMTLQTLPRSYPRLPESHLEIAKNNTDNRGKKAAVILTVAIAS
jgi:cytochrome c553